MVASLQSPVRKQLVLRRGQLVEAQLISRTNARWERRGKEKGQLLPDSASASAWKSCRSRQGQGWEGQGILRFLHGENWLWAVGRGQREGSHGYSLHFTFFWPLKGIPGDPLLINLCTWCRDGQYHQGRVSQWSKVSQSYLSDLSPTCAACAPGFSLTLQPSPSFSSMWLCDFPSPNQGHLNPKEIPQHLK